MKTSFHAFLDLLLFFAILAIAPANRAATITWTNLNGGSWNAATNWNPNQVPGASDTAVITASGSYTVTLDTSGTVAALTLGGATGKQTLRHIGGALVLTGAGTVNANGVFEFVNGSLGGGPMTVSGLLTWTGGSMDGALTVATNGVLNISGGGAVSLNGTITNAGWMTLTNAAYVYLAGSLYNLAGATVEQRNDRSWANGGGSPLFHNAGTFRKLASSGTTTFDGGVAFVNAGLVDAQTGTLNFPAGFVSSGSFQVPADTSVNLTGGTFEFKAGHRFTGAGFYGISGGTVNIIGDLADANFAWTGGTLRSTNRITGTLNWTAGALDGALTVATNGVLNISGGGAVSLNGTITNAGWITLANAAYVYLAGSLYNLAGATVEQRNDRSWANGGGNPLFHNAGTFRKLASSGTTTFDGGVAFVNAGLVDAQTGTLNFPAGFVSSGSFQVPADTSVNLTGGTFEFKAGHRFTGAGFYGISGGTVNIIGDLADANFAWTGGTLRSTNRITGTLNWTGGSMDGALTVATNGVLNISGGGAVFLNGTITNAGWMTLTNTAYVFLAGSLYNLADGTVEQRNDRSWANGGGSPLFHNAGTFRKLASSGTTTFDGGVAFVNAGLVDVQTGTLNFPAGFVSSGSFQVPADTSVNLTGGTFEFKAGHRFTGAGFYGISGGTVNIIGDLADANFAWTGGTLRSTNRITGTLNWTAGALDGALTVATNGVLNISGGGAVSLNGTITNAGWITLANAAYVYLAGSLYNLAGATVEQRNDRSWANGGGNPLFHNAGTFRKLASSGTTTFDGGVAFVNAGLVDVQTGTLNFPAGFVSSGSFQVPAGTSVNLTGGTFEFKAGHRFTGAGFYGISGGTVNIIGDLADANFAWTGGTLRSTNRITGTLNWTAGALDGALTVATNAVLNISGGGAVSLNGTITNAGLITLADTVTVYLVGSLYNLADGTVEQRNDRSWANNGGSPLFHNAGTFRKLASSGTTTFGGGVAFVNAGLVDVQTGTLNFDDGFTQTAGSTILNGGNLSASRPIEIQGGSLAGSGTITATVTNSSQLNPGASAGVLNIVGHYIQTASGVLNIELAGLTPDTFDQLTVSQTASLDGLLQTTLIRAFMPPTNSDFLFLSANAVNGTFVRHNYPSNLVDLRIDYTSTSASIKVLNVFTNVTIFPPVITAVPDSTVDELAQLRLTITATDADGPTTVLTFRLDGAPEGAAIDYSTGVLTWTPTEVQGPGTYPITVRVTDNGGLFDTKTFNVVVNELNQPPVLTAIPAQIIGPGLTLAFTAVASDADLPTQILTFTLGSGAQPGMDIHSTSGRFTWAVPAGQPAGQYSVTVRVTDNGPGSLIAAQVVVIEVDRNGPRILSMTPSGLVSNSVDHVDITFDKPINPATFDSTDIDLRGNPGPVVTSVQLLDAVRYRISFAALSFGDYTLKVGPQVADLAGNSMNQDGDTTNGEPEQDLFNGQVHIRLPDLLVGSITAPAQGLIGQPITLTWVVTNQGNAAVSLPWNDMIILVNKTPPGGEQELAHFTFTNALPAGQSITNTRSLIISAGVSGQRYVKIRTDYANQVDEGTHENNNTTEDDQPIEILAPDLIVTSVSTPANAQFGQPMTVVWTVKNVGTGQALASWNDNLYLSTETNSLAGAMLLLTQPVADVAPLAAGASYTRTQTATLPLNSALSAGKYYIVIAANADGAQPESNHDNNTASQALTLSPPPLPDLMVSQIVAPATAMPAQPVELSWTITNQGNLAASGTWSETISISNYPPLDTFVYTNTLAAGASLVRTQFITIPLNGPAGTLHFQVEVDSGWNIAESNDTNNLIVASTSTTVPAMLSLLTPFSEIAENAPAGRAQAAVTRNGDRAQPLVVSLESSDSTELTVPATVTIQAGQVTAFFEVTARMDGIVDGPQQVTVTAAANGFTGVVAPITVLDVDKPRLTLVMDETNVLKSAMVIATVQRDPATPEAVVVQLSSSDAARLSVPATVTIPANSGSAWFQVEAINDYLITAPRVYTVTASTSGFVSGSALIQVTDSHIPGLSINLGAPEVSEAAGALAATGTVIRDTVGPRPLVVALESSHPNVARVPSSVTIPAGASSASFQIAAIDNEVVDGKKTVLIRAYLIDALTGARISASSPASLDVLDDDGPTLRLQLDREVVAEGLSPASTATVWRNSDPGISLAVTIVSSDTSEATVPATVMIPAGQTSMTFPVTSVNDGATDGDQIVMLTASAPGFTSSTARLTVTDRDLPDLTVASISTPPTGVTDGSFEVTYRVANGGLAAASGSILQRVFLSSDAAIGDDTLIGQAEFSGTVTPGSYFDQTLTLRLPRTPGNYWVIVTADSSEKVAEILENNNVAISAQPIRVEKTYGATVQAEIEVAPAGTPIPLHGQATLTGSGQPAPFSQVNIHLEVRGTKRLISVQTDRDGRFATVFQPLPGEAGRYQVGADFPGVTQTAVQDSFVLLGLRVTPPAGTLRVIEGGQLTGSARVENLGDLPLNGLAAAIIEKPANLQVSLNLTNTLAGLAETSLAFTITPTDTSIPQGLVLVRLSNPDGVSADLYLPVAIDRLRPLLMVEPGSLVAGMKRGGQTTVQFQVSNTGGAASGELNVMPPAIPWLMVASGATLASLVPGSNTTVTLILTPPADLALGDHQGSIVISGAAASVTVPFVFRSLSVAAGDLKVTAVDEYTYYAQGSPNVTNATVSVTDELSGQLVASGLTDARGQFMVTNLTEAYYRLDVRADGHGSHHSTFLLGAGKTNDVLAFLPRDTVKYIWSVVPTEIEDRTRINIETVFETVVPIPVVTVEPMLIDLAGFQGEETQVDLKITNHGLVAAENTRLDFESHPEISVTPLVSQIGTLKAKSSITVPLIIRRLHPNLQAASLAKPSGHVSASSSAPSCDVRGGAFWDLICGPTVRGNGVPIVLQNAGNNCGSGGQAGLFAGGGFGGFFTGAGGTGFEGSGGVTPAVYWGPIEGNTKSPCNLCPLKMLVSAADCAYKFVAITVLECLKNSYKCASGPPTPVTAYYCSKAFYKCLETAGATFTYLSYLKLFECAAGMLTACDSGSTSAAASQQSTHQTAFRVDGRAEAASAVSRPELEPLRKQVDRLGKLVEADLLMFGDPAWFQDETGEAQRWLGVFLSKVEETSDAGPTVSAAERAQLLALNMPAQVAATNVNKFVDRWNRTLDYNAVGIFRLADVPNGQSTDFIAYDLQQSTFAAAMQAINEAEAEGYASVPEAVEDARRQLVSFYQKDSGGGDCATVRLRIEQQAVITRDAFDATLEIINSTGGSLENVSVELQVQAENGEVSTSLFGIRPPKLQGLSGVDGTGVINANSTGKASWIIIPTSEAAPLGPKVFFVSGKLAYVQGGVPISIPLAPASITVLPNASLKVEYFHQRDVFSDDPFTPEIEPSIPFSLGVLIQNNGNGVARNVRITSAQPKIIDNEKGLLIDFEIIGSEVNGQNASPSLSASFGNITPGQVAVGRWLLRSSLQGLFTDYQASFEHLDGLGDKRLSLIDSVEIHEMNHVVRADGPFEDGLPDFLVNDLPDLQDMPDTLYLSDGRIQPVSLVSQATTDAPPVSGHLQVALSATMPPGWAYLHVPDPSQGQFRLARVLRANGSEVRLEDNVWITDRTFVGNAQRPVRESMLHLLDFDSTGAYTLVYGELPAADLTPPVSIVAALPPNSFAQIPVRWSGEDDTPGSGLDFYDIFVSVNGGPFSPWLRQTTLTGALYAGIQNEFYAFYSVATDRAGNREAAHNTPDTQTTVNLVNTAPQLTVPASVVLNEGATLVVTNTAIDLDVPANVLQFSLDPGAPLGAVIDPFTGVLTWITSESTGPSTNQITVRVTDNGIPSLSATGVVQVVVLEVNQTPVLDPVPDQMINEGKKLMLTAKASDSDLPANQLTFRLDAGAPAGASITPSGIFTWTPTALQGPSTNLIGIIVADNGIPSLTATQTFSVEVRDVLGDFVVGLGSTNVLTGQRAAVLVTLSSGAELTKVTFTIEVPETRLTNLVLQPLVSEIAFASIQPAGPDRSRVQLIAGAGQVLDGNRTVAQLGFEAVSARDSALVSIGIEQLEGERGNGSRLTNGIARAGRVIVIGLQPVLEAARTPDRSLVLYGRPGISYGIEFKTNLTATAPWTYLTRVPLTNTFLSIGGLDFSRPFVCYRSYEFVAKPALLEVRRSDQPNASLLLYGEPGAQYQVQSTADISDEQNWLPELTVTLTNSFRFIERTNLTGPSRFFRIREQ